MMKNKLLICLFLFSLTSSRIFSATVTVTITYGGAQSQGCCNICGADYWCANNPYGCGTTAACDARPFFDPVPAGNIITGVSVLYYAAGCYGSSFPTYINGCYIGAAPTNSQCACGSCTAYSFSNNSFPCGMPCYNYGGSNSFSICPNGPACFQRAIITLTYTPSTGLMSFAPTSASASPNPTCGGSTTLTEIGGSLGAGATWNWYAGSCGGTFLGTGASISVTPSSTTTYFVRAQGTCNTTGCAQITVTVASPSVAPSSASASPNPTCGGATTLTENGGSLGTSAVYNWYSGSCGGTFVGTGSSISISPSSTTTYFVLAQGTCNTTACASVTVNVNSVSAAPTAATASPSAVCAGTSTTLTEIGGSLGAGAVYNWYSGSCGGTFVGTGSSITVTPTATTTYFVRAQGSCNTTGCASVIVTVNSIPFGSATPSAPSVCSGATTSIVLSSFTPGTTYTWTVTPSGVSGATNCPSGCGTTIAQTLTYTAAPGTVTYTVTPTAAGCVGNPFTVVVTVNPIPVATATPTAQTICSGGTTSIALTSTVPGTIFNWTVVQTLASGGTNGSSTSTIAQVLTALSPTSAGTVVYTVTPTANGCPGAPITVTITVNPKPITTATPPSQTICSGNATAIALTSNIPGATFKWTVVQTGGVTGGTNGTGTNITDVLTTTTAGTAVYTIIDSANACPGIPLQVTVTVNPKDNASFTYSATSFCQSGLNPTPTITGLSGGTFTESPAGLSINASTGTITLASSTIGAYTVTYTTNGICPNTSTTSVTVTSAPLAGFSYTGSPYCQYGSNPLPTYVPGGFGGTFSSTPPGLVFVNVNTGEINLATSTPGTYTVKNNILASGGCAADSATSSVTISRTSLATASPSPQTICSGTASSIILSGTIPGTTFAWTAVQTNVTGATPDTGSSIAQTLTSTVIGTVIYTITPTFGLCSGAPIKDTVTVNPIPTAITTPPSQTFCSGGTTSIAISGTGTSFSWTASEAGVTGATFGTGTSISQTLINSTTIPGTAIYAVTPKALGCLGPAQNVIITVNPRDNASFVYSSATYCQSGGTETPVITGLPGGTFSSTPAGLTINPSTGTIILATSNLGAYSLSYITNGTCPDTSSITMTISNTAPVATFSYLGSPFCQNGVDPAPVFASGASAGIFSAIPAGLVFVHVNTGVIDLSACAAGTYTVTNTIPASGNCPGTSATTTVVITASDNASFTYTSATYCKSGSNPTPVITGLPGGIFSSTPAGLSLNPTTGTITLSSSVIGLYTLSYHTNGPCPNTSSIVMTIDSVTPSANFIYLGSPFCHNGNDPSPVFGSGASAGIFSATPGGLVFVNVNTGQVDLVASTPGTYTVKNTIPVSGNCFGASATSVITISPADNASFVYSSATYCQTGGPNETPIITGLPGGTFLSVPPGLSINPSTGTINVPASSVGSYTLSYTTNGPCQNTSSITMSITASNNFAGFSYPNPTYCQNGTNPIPVFNPGATAGVFTTNPLGLAFVNINTGEIDLALSTPGTYTITNTVPAGGGCAAVSATSTVTITVSDNASFVYTSATYCTSGTPQTPAITGLPGGVFSSSPAGLSINPSTGTITLSSSAVSIYTVSYTTTGGCPSTSSISMNIISSTPFANMSYPGSPFCSNSNNPSPVFGNGASAGIFTVSPGGLIFVHVNTGQIDLSASTPGTYTVTNTIPPSGTCGAVSATAVVVITPKDNASFIYSSATYCQTGPNPTPSITGLPGGTFLSIPPGLSINPTTGVINLATSAVGAYTLSYTTNGPCPNTSFIIMTINASSSSATFSYPGSPFCQNGTNPYPTFSSGGSAGIYTSAPAGLVFIHVNTGQINLSASTPGTYTITNTIPASGGCAAVVATSTVTINAPDNASFTYTSATYCTTGSPQSPLSIATPGGTFSSVPPGLSVNPTTGTITLSTSNLGVYALSYRTNGTCPDTTSITMTITNTTPFANFNYPGSPYCQFGTNPFPSFGSGASAGTYTSTPAGLVFINVNTGQINLSLSAPGTYLVTNTIPVSGTCGAVSATSTVVIGGAPTAIATPVSQNVCTGSATSINLTSSTPGTSYSWTVLPTSVTGASASFGSTISQTLTYSGSGIGTGTAIYTITPIANSCPGLPITVVVTVHTLPVADTSAVVISPAKCGSTTGGISGVTMTAGHLPFTYQWKDSLGNIVGTSTNLTNVGPGKYTLVVTDSFGCSITAGGNIPFTIVATPPVVAAFTANPITGETPLTVNFTNNSSSQATNYLWEFGTGDTSTAVNPSYVYHPLGHFTVCLIAGNGYGCNDTVCDSINVYINSVFIVPNIFTPNGDNVNDMFTLKSVGLKTVDAEIYNRWGQKEYEWHTTNGGWDGYTASGVEAPGGTYFYIINATGIDGKKYFEKGSFTLVRDK